MDAGPHPNPAKAADGKRIQRLLIDEIAATVVQRIFAEFVGLAGFRERGYQAIAEGLNHDGIPCPSAHDPTRNRHRSGAAWSKPTFRTILQNPRYTGCQVWNKQRKGRGPHRRRRHRARAHHQAAMEPARHVGVL